MNPALRDAVRTRAGDKGEYCRLPQSAIPTATFHVEHICAVQHGGSDDFSNLALACDRCNLYKGPNLTSTDPVTGMVVRLFNPRTQIWAGHFELSGYVNIGRTDVGRATVKLLNMNAPRRVQLRAALVAK